MKMNKALLGSLALLLFAIGCQDHDSDKTSFKDLSANAQQFIKMRFGSALSMTNSSDAMVNSSYRGLVQKYGMNTGGRIKGDSTSTDPDSTIWNEPWRTCATITTIQNNDGTTTTITDYGDGCQEGMPGYYYWMHGKSTQIYKYIYNQDGTVFTNDYLFKGKYENFGGNFSNADSTAWNIEGENSYSGYSSYDTAWHVFFGSYNFSDSSIYTYNGVNSAYQSKGNGEYDAKRYVVKQSEYSYNNDQYFYHSKVTQQLVYDYTCNKNDGTFVANNFVWIPVSGKEVISSTIDGVSSTFEIDYGDGDCDNIAVITENGKRVRVDFGDPKWID